MTELLAPAGSLQKLKTAVHFGADAVYFGGKNFGLRAFSSNFDEKEIEAGLKYLHSHQKRGFVTINIFPKNADFDELKTYIGFLKEVKADAVIVSDPGVFMLCRKYYPEMEVHISTQANTINKYSAKFWEQAGAKRIVLARELSIQEISEIKSYLNPSTELEAFVHGAMCISYSGRCLLSNYLSGRDSNRGQCVQACRWEYEIREKDRKGNYLTIQEDGKGTYILNSKDLNLIKHLQQIIAAGVYSLKIEGRMKSEYYVGTVVNSYRRAIDALSRGEEFNEMLYLDLFKTAHRDFTSAYALGENKETQNYNSSVAESDYEFSANVLGYDKEKGLKIMQRNRFKKGDVLEVLARGENFNKQIVVDIMTDENGEIVEDAKLVQQILYLKTEIELEQFDMLRKIKTKK